MRILAVEDDPDVAWVYRVLFGSAHSVVDVAADLGSAWRHLATDPLPALLLLDRHLPDGDGLVLCREVRTRYPTLPVVLVTASGITRQDALAAGASAFLPKPFDVDELEALVQGLLAHA